MSPLPVSVVLPVHNAAHCVGAAIRSALSQNVAEVIVVNDGSTEPLAAAMAPFQRAVRLISQPRRGPAAARNAGAVLARERYLAFLDADDLWPPGALERAVRTLEGDPSYGGTHGMTQALICQDSVSRGEPLGRPWWSPQLGSVVMRHSAFSSLRGLDESLRHGEDLDWFVRAREHEVALFRDDAVSLFYRLHGKNMILDRAQAHHGAALVLKRALDRRRWTGTTRGGRSSGAC